MLKKNDSIVFEGLDLELLEKNVKYLWEAERKASFTSWVFSDKSKCNISKLAEAGFIFMGDEFEPDSVACFLCQKVLDSWDEDDDPWNEHIKHAKYCNFAKKGKKEDALTLSEFVDIKHEFIMKLLQKCKEEQLQTISKMFGTALKITSEKLKL